MKAHESRVVSFILLLFQPRFAFQKKTEKLSDLIGTSLTFFLKLNTSIFCVTCSKHSVLLVQQSAALVAFEIDLEANN